MWAALGFSPGRSGFRNPITSDPTMRPELSPVRYTADGVELGVIPLGAADGRLIGVHGFALPLGALEPGRLPCHRPRRGHRGGVGHV